MLSYIALAVLLVFVLLFFFVAKKASQEIDSLRNFFSFKKEHGVGHLRDSFEASNASFGTAFVTLFLYVGWINGIAIWVPVGFCLGILFFANLIFPHMVRVYETGQRYPELLSKLTGQKFIRIFASLTICSSLILFVFAEIRAFSIFFSNIFEGNVFVSWIFPVSVVLGTAMYTSIGGFQAVVKTDRWQKWLIYLGTISLIILIVMWSNKNWDSLDFSRVEFLASDINGVRLILSLLVGFSFSQLLYYDNWFRLSVFISCKKEEDEDFNLESLAKEIQRGYNISSVTLLVIYLTPIALAMIFVAAGTKVDSPNQIVQAFISFLPYGGGLGTILVTLILAQLVAALVSTVDTYILSATASIGEDVFGWDIQSSDKGGRQLDAARLIAVALVAVLLPFIFHPLEFTRFFDFIFFSVNGFVGPLVIGIMLKRTLDKWCVYVSIFGGFLISYVMIFEFDGVMSGDVGLASVLFSLAICWIGSKRGEIDVSKS